MWVRVRRVSGMPHNVVVWVDGPTVYVDCSLITVEGASCLESALNDAVKLGVFESRISSSRIS